MLALIMAVAAIMGVPTVIQTIKIAVELVTMVVAATTLADFIVAAPWLGVARQYVSAAPV